MDTYIYLSEGQKLQSVTNSGLLSTSDRMYCIEFWSHVTVVQGGVYAHKPRVGRITMLSVIPGWRGRA
jgi:hypothetical protein